MTPRHGRLKSGLIFLAGSVVSSFLFPAQALDPSTALSQYIHDQWGVEQGFTGGAVYAFAETPDGYLWVGTEKGLIRFDGSNFRLFNHANVPTFPVSSVVGLTTDTAGGLWIRFQSPDLLRYKDGRFDLPFPTRSPSEAFTATLETASGELLLARSNGILRYSKGRFSKLPEANDALNLLVISMAEAADGNIWLGTRDAGLFSLANGHITNVTKGLPERKVNSIVTVDARQLWIGTDAGVVRWTGSQLTDVGVPSPLHHLQVSTMITDPDSNIWIATANGLLRVTAEGASAWDKHFDRKRDRVSALFEDRDGNLWVGSEGRIERFRDSVFTSHTRTEGPLAGNGGPVFVDAESRIWFAPSDGGLYWMKGQHIEEVRQDGLPRDVIYSIAGGDGALWIGRQSGKLTRLQYHERSLFAETYLLGQRSAETSILSVYRSRDGTIWAGTLGGGVTRLKDGHVSTYTTANGLASDDVNSIAETPNHIFWFAGPNGLTMLSNGRWRIFTSADGLPPGSIKCLFKDSAGVLWIGTGRGLAFIRAGKVVIPDNLPESLMMEISGIGEDLDGWLWITTANHIIRVNQDALQRGKLLNGNIREYGTADGLHALEGVNAIASDGRGRIWFSMHRGLSVVNTLRLNGESAPAAAEILGISADGKPFNLDTSVQVPSDRQRLTFQFTGLSLSDPERFRFRYRLDGFDRTWIDAVGAHEAAYTNLNPGSYRFRVLASNLDGIWNGHEAALNFEIEPAFWQTWWFRIITLFAIASFVVAAYRYRLRYLTRQLNVRFEERLAERTRIAQELHDTLLQGVLSASMLLNVTADTLSSESPVKALLSRVLQLMSQVTEEGRKTLRGLRSKDDILALDQAFSKIAAELAIEEDFGFRVIVEGEPRALRPVLRDDVYRIGREALLNAFRHSGATQIEAELEYGAKYFRVLVRDDGCGIKSEILQSGLQGHWGLIGMRERAEKIGAQLNVWTRDSGGTEIQLFVPNYIAFENGSSGHFWTWLTRTYSQRPTRK